MRAPDFNLPDQNGKTHKLSDYSGEWLVLYFYPKDETSGCTTEACNFRDSRVLSDESGKVIEAYGAWGEKSLYGKKYMGILRNTYLINPKGEIVKEYKGVKPETHSAEILKDLDSF